MQMKWSNDWWLRTTVTNQVALWWYIVWIGWHIRVRRIEYSTSTRFFFFDDNERNFSIPLLTIYTLRGRKILFPYSSFIVFYRNTFNDLCDTVLTVKKGNKSQQDLSKHNSCARLSEPLEVVVVFFSLQRNCRTFFDRSKVSSIPLSPVCKSTWKVNRKAAGLDHIWTIVLNDSKASLHLKLIYFLSSLHFLILGIYICMKFNEFISNTILVQH